MNDIIGYFVKSLASSTLSLRKKSILVEKPWALIDNDGKVQKLIFKKNNGLILSKNGMVTEGSWEYYPEAGALLIDRGVDKVLLKEQFIDPNVLILKKDGSDNEFFALANENTLPDYNIPEYLNSIRCQKLKIKNQKLFNGNTLHIHDVDTAYYVEEYRNKHVEIVNSGYAPTQIEDGNYLSEDKEVTFKVQGNKIVSVLKNIVVELKGGGSFEIIDGYAHHFHGNINKQISLNGKAISDCRLTDDNNFIYIIENKSIKQIVLPVEHKLNDGTSIVIEQKDSTAIRKGDEIISSSGIYPIPDGKYKIKGKWSKVKVVDCIIC